MPRGSRLRRQMSCSLADQKLQSLLELRERVLAVPVPRLSECARRIYELNRCYIGGPVGKK
jgi:hypothetical protein